MRLQEAYDKYHARADFYWIYIREAHPTDSSRPARHVRIEQPKTYERRSEVATMCSGDLKLTIPVLVDGMDAQAARSYAAFPDRLYILGPDNRIAVQGGRGPREFSVSEMTAALENLLGKK